MANKTEKRTVEIIMNGRAAGEGIRTLRNDVRVLSGYIENKLTPGTKEFINASKKLQETQAEYRRLRSEIYGVASATNDASKNLGKSLQSSFAVVAAGIVAAKGLYTFLADGVKNAAKLDDELADIMKTTGMVKSEALLLNKAFAAMDTRTSTEELRKIAVVAGQLGIAKEDIYGFTESVDKLFVALGDELGNAEKTSNTVGGLRDIFKDIKTDDVSKDLLQIGNALNVLGADGRATADVVSDFSNRIGGVTIPLGFTSGQVLGLSATLQELNVSAERGSTAVNRIVQKMLTDIKTFAGIAGMEVGEFKTLLDTDLFGAFTKVIEGSTRTGASATAFAAILKDAELQGSGASEVFSKLSSNIDFLNGKVITAGESLQSTNSITNEFEVKNQTLGATIDKLGKSIERIMSAFTPVFNALGTALGFYANKLDEALNGVTPLTDAMKDLHGQFQAEMAVLMDANVTQEARVKLIEQINTKYGEYLPFLITEADNYQKLGEALEYANSKFEEKILLTVKDELTTRKTKQLADTYESELFFLTHIEDLKKRGAKEDDQRMKDAKRALDSVLKERQGIISGIAETGKVVDKQLQTLLDKRNAAFGAPKTNLTGLSVANDRKTPAPVANMVASISPEEQKQIDKKLEAQQKMYEKLQEMEHENYLGTLSNNERELQAIRDKYAAIEKQAVAAFTNTQQRNQYLQALAQQQQTAIDAKRIEQNAELMEELSKQMQKLDDETKRMNDENAKDEQEKAKAITQINQAVTDANLTDAEKEIQQVEAKYMALIEIARQYGIDTYDLEMAMITAIDKLREEQATAENKRLEDEAAKRRALVQQQVEGWLNYAQQANDIGNTLAQITANRQEAQLQGAQAAMQKELQALDEQKNKKLITETEYNQKRKEIEQNYRDQERAVKRQQFERQRTADIIQASVNTALAVTRALSTTGPVGAFIAGAAGAAQIALIANKPMPAFAAGGKTNVSAGGNIVGGKQLAWVNEKGPEWVAPNWMITNPAYFDTFAALENIRLRGYEQGGFTATTTAPPVPVAATTTAPQELVEKTNTTLIMASQAINTLNRTIKSGIPALYTDTEIRRFSERQTDFTQSDINDNLL